MSTEIITAVLSGFITALVIETLKQINERKKTLEFRKLEQNKQLHAFLEYDETLRQVRPVARLLISSHSKRKREYLNNLFVHCPKGHTDLNKRPIFFSLENL